LDEDMSEASSGAPRSTPPSWALRAAFGVAALGVAAFLYAVFAGLSKPETGGFERFATGSLKKLEVLDKPPAQARTTLQTADGYAARLSDFRGQVVVMNLWGTWCAPCVAEMPTLGALQRAYAHQPLQVVAVNLDPVKLRAKAVEQLDRLTEGSLKFYTDPTLAIAFESGASRGMPVTVIYAKDGRELARLFGAADWSSPEARALIEAALAE
jgi:thiol-disulfide isomerase/thioredoxin